MSITLTGSRNHKKITYFYHPHTKFREGNVFTRVCNSAHGGGACMAGGNAWQGDMRGMVEGACIAEGHAWQGAYMAGGMHGGGCVAETCVAGGGRGHARYTHVGTNQSQGQCGDMEE